MCFLEGRGVLVISSCLVLIFVTKGNGFPTEKDTARELQGKLLENPNLVEGDMILHPVDLTVPRGVARRGNGVAWKNGIVPYEFSPGFTLRQQSFVVETMHKLERLIAINNVACVQFRPKVTTDRHFITIMDGSGCSSTVGESIGNLSEHPVTLNYPGCFVERIIMHEFLHTLGFYHEQSRPDRDDYIQVIYDNIFIDNRHNFEKYDDVFVNTLNTPYDYSSIMHYSPTAFSNNGQPTIIPLRPNVTIGQRDTLSAIDVQEVRSLYNCSAAGVTLPTITTTTTANVFLVNTTLASAWTNISRRYARTPDSSGLYFYEAFQVTVPVNGPYMFISDSTIDTYGCLHSGSFSPETPTENQLDCDDDSAGRGLFKIIAHLQSDVPYTILATTFQENTIGEYVLVVSGPHRVNVIPTDNTSVVINANVTTTRPTVPSTTTTTTGRPASIVSSTTTTTTARPASIVSSTTTKRRPTLATPRSNAGKLSMSALFIVGQVLSTILILYSSIIS